MCFHLIATNECRLTGLDCDKIRIIFKFEGNSSVSQRVTVRGKILASLGVLQCLAGLERELGVD